MSDITDRLKRCREQDKTRENYITDRLKEIRKEENLKNKIYNYAKIIGFTTIFSVGIYFAENPNHIDGDLKFKNPYQDTVKYDNKFLPRDGTRIEYDTTRYLKGHDKYE